MEINTPLLEASLQKIKDHPELHNQRAFFRETECGTAHCLGGWALQLAGVELADKDFINWDRVRMPDGSIKRVWSAARQILGLSDAEAVCLFSAGNTVAMLEAMVKDVSNTGTLATWDHYYDLFH